MDTCCTVCHTAGDPSEYDIYRHSEKFPLTRDQSTNCRSSSCIWKFRIITMCLTVMCIIMIGYLIYLQSLLSNSAKEFFDHGAVATDNVNCSKIGTEILKNGGNAVDAAVAATFCITVVAPYKTGLGGGGIAMVYNRVVDDEPLVVDFATNTISGTLASAKVRIPAVIRGLEFLHKLRGSLPWRKVVEPAESLAQNGFFITSHFSEAVKKFQDHGFVFGYLEAGKVLKLPHLAETLEAIKNHGSQILYNGSLTLKFLHDESPEAHDNLRLELANYQPLKRKGRKSHFYNYTVYSPEHAKLFHSILEHIDQLKVLLDDTALPESQLEIAKTLMKTEITDQNIEQERYTSVIAVDSRRNFVSILTGLSVPLGLGHMTGAGFLLDTVEAGNNLSMLTPIIFDSIKNPNDYSGALGVDDPILGSEILSNLLLQNLNLSIAIETQRYYRLYDGALIEPIERYPLDESLKLNLSNLLPMSYSTISEYTKSVNAVIKQNNAMYSHSDSRGGGVASRY